MMKRLALLALVIGVLFSGFYLFRSKKSIIPIQTSTFPASSVETDSIKDQIIQALSQKNNWDASSIELNITAVEGDFAKGDVKFKNEMGGGLWFAAMTNGTWKIVYDGNGIITCDQLANYPDFPKDLIPNCYDNQTDESRAR